MKEFPPPANPSGSPKEVHIRTASNGFVVQIGLSFQRGGHGAQPEFVFQTLQALQAWLTDYLEDKPVLVERPLPGRRS